MTTTITTDNQPSPEATTEVQAETLRLAEEAGRASAQAVGASIDAAEARRIAEEAVSSSRAAMAGQIVTVEMMTAVEGRLSAMTTALESLTARLVALESDDDDAEETEVTEVAPVQQPAATTDKPKDATGLVGRMFFR